MNRNLIRTSLLMIFMSIPVGYSNVVFAEAPVYSLDPVYVVGAHKVLDSDKFGNIITEQSYYRTGGDVEVVNRKEIEDHHYNSISEAIKSIPRRDIFQSRIPGELVWICSLLQCIFYQWRYPCCGSC